MTALIDLSNKRFGRWLVIKKLPYDGIQTKWLCQCDCGVIKSVQGEHLRNGVTTNCGCQNGVPENLVGRKFAKLLVLDEYRKIPRNKKNTFSTYWLCLCDCGKSKFINAFSLKRGNALSCGSCKTPDITEWSGPRGCFRGHYSAYKGRAKDNKWEFDLTLEDFRKIVTKPCHYCNIEYSLVKKDKNKLIKCCGIDRLDNSIGYIKDNVVPACHTCNRMKLKMSKKEFLSWITKIYNHSCRDVI